MSNHYIYEYLDTRGNLLYIGRGLDRDGSFARAKNLNGHSGVRRWLKPGRQIQIHLVSSGLTALAATELETILIRKLRPKLNKNRHKSDSYVSKPVDLLKVNSVGLTLKQLENKTALMLKDYKVGDNTLTQIRRNLVMIAESYDGRLYECKHPGLSFDLISDHFYKWYSEEDLDDELPILLSDLEVYKKQKKPSKHLETWNAIRDRYKALSEIYGFKMPSEFRLKNKPVAP